MKNIVLLLFPMYLFSQNSSCFDDGKQKYSTRYFLNESLETILLSNPKHIKYMEDKNNTSYEEDQKNRYEKPITEQSAKKKQTDYNKKYAPFIKYFNNEFNYIQIQNDQNISYAIAENSFGYWLLESKSDAVKAYYIGLSKNMHLNNHQKETFIKDNTLFLKGSIVNFSQSSPRMREAIEVLKDLLTFEVNIEEVKKDTDQDGYNDLFENLIFLNPNSKDTDNDGIPDFSDTNPLYKSGNHKFSDLYTQIIDSSFGYENISNPYRFAAYRSECDYFQRINPKSRRVLIYSDDQSYRLNIAYKKYFFSNSYGKINEDKDGKTVYIPYYESSSGGKIIAEYENGKWVFYEHEEYKI